MKITMPEGFTPPKNSRPGEPFEVVATIRPTEEGQFMIVAVDGMEMPVEVEEEEIVEEPVDERIDSANVRLPFGEEESNEYA
jgi:hypothetical protein